jgi:hypothetical protein
MFHMLTISTTQTLVLALHQRRPQSPADTDIHAPEERNRIERPAGLSRCNQSNQERLPAKGG